MKVVAQRNGGVELLVEMDDGSARVIDTERHEWLDAATPDSVLARGGGWEAYDGDADPAEIMRGMHPAAVV